MKNEIVPFGYNQLEVRTVTIDSEPWFVLKDVADVIEMNLSSMNKIFNRLDEDEKGRYKVPTLGGEQELNIISEPGLYSVLLRSNKPKAKQFYRWVTHDVIPSIRKQGYYSALPDDVLLEKLMCMKIIDENKYNELIADTMVEDYRLDPKGFQSIPKNIIKERFTLQAEREETELYTHRFDLTYEEYNRRLHKIWGNNTARINRHFHKHLREIADLSREPRNIPTHTVRSASLINFKQATKDDFEKEV
jgi:prophage antirepressor-like protein